MGALGCGEEASAPADVVRPIKILEIGGASDESRREYPGTVRAAQSAELAFEVQGKLTDFPIEEGQAVEEGQVLARIDPRDYESRLDKAQANVNNARTEFDRARKLFEEGVLAEAEKDRRQRELEVAQADLNEATKAREDAVLRAPFAGVVARKLVDDFANVQAKEPVVLLQDDSSLEVVVDVPERDVGQGGDPFQEKTTITRRLDPKVIVTSLPDQAFAARVKEFATAADPTTRTFQGTLAFDPPQGTTVLPGMTAKVSIRISADEGASGLSIPALAVLADESGASYVWVVDPSSMSVARRSVEVGELAGDRITVLSGLGPGDQVATSGVHHLREGTIVSRAAN